mgnify:CR=1 FL=1
MEKVLLDKLKKIKLVATDIDGVWTDTKMYYTDNGEYMKSFSTYDGMAVEMLHKHNFIVAVLTSENSLIVKQRAKKLNIQEVYIHEKEKLLRLNYLIQKYNLSLNEVAYIGDDINDLECLQSVGVSAMPQSSPILHRFKSDIITNCIGGNGAFREFVDCILSAHNIIPEY